MSSAGQTRRASSIFVDVVPGFASGAPLGGAFDAEGTEHRRTVGRRAVVSSSMRQAGAGAVREVARPGPAAVIGAKLRRMGGCDGVRGRQLLAPTKPSHDIRRHQYSSVADLPVKKTQTNTNTHILRVPRELAI